MVIVAATTCTAVALAVGGGFALERLLATTCRVTDRAVAAEFNDDCCKSLPSGE